MDKSVAERYQIGRDLYEAWRDAALSDNDNPPAWAMLNQRERDRWIAVVLEIERLVERKVIG